MAQINQDLDETSTEKVIEVADLRAKVRAEILFPDGSYKRHRIRDIAAAAIVGEQTVINLATGKTKTPSSWTLKRVALAIGYRQAMVPIETPKLKGEIGYRESKQ